MNENIILIRYCNRMVMRQKDTGVWVTGGMLVGAPYKGWYLHAERGHEGGCLHDYSLSPHSY